MVQRLEGGTTECNSGEKLALCSCRKAEIVLRFLVWKRDSRLFCGFQRLPANRETAALRHTEGAWVLPSPQSCKPYFTKSRRIWGEIPFYVGQELSI